MTQTNFNTIKFSSQAPNAIIQISRPEVLNAVNTEFWHELSLVLDQILTLDEIKAIIITGEGRAFSSGADLKESKTRTLEQYGEYLNLLQEVTRKILSFPRPCIAAIQGYAIGSGIELALACDFRIAARGSRISFPEAKVSSSATGGTLLLLPGLIGSAKAREMMFLGREITGEEAASIGLVNQCVEDGLLLQSAIELGEELSGNSSDSLAVLKLGLYETLLPQLERIMKYEVDSCLSAVSSSGREKAIERFNKDSS